MKQFERSMSVCQMLVALLMLREVKQKKTICSLFLKSCFVYISWNTFTKKRDESHIQLSCSCFWARSQPGYPCRGVGDGLYFVSTGTSFFFVQPQRSLLGVSSTKLGCLCLRATQNHFTQGGGKQRGPWVSRSQERTSAGRSETPLSIKQLLCLYLCVCSRTSVCVWCYVYT